MMRRSITRIVKPRKSLLSQAASQVSNMSHSATGDSGLNRAHNDRSKR